MGSSDIGTGGADWNLTCTQSGKLPIIKATVNGGSRSTPTAAGC
jgi:hypothetical protein